MKIKEILAAVLVISLSVFLALGLALGVASLFQAAPSARTFGSASDNALPLAPTATRVFVKSTDTLVAATSTGRQYLEIQNASGATTTAQQVSCNFGDRPAVLYSGLTLFASTSKTFNLDNLYRGAIHCIAPSNGALITVTDF
jgi:hypothetical protein